MKKNSLFDYVLKILEFYFMMCGVACMLSPFHFCYLIQQIFKNPSALFASYTLVWLWALLNFFGFIYQMWKIVRKFTDKKGEKENDCR